MNYNKDTFIPGKYFLVRKVNGTYYTGIYNLVEILEDGFLMDTGGVAKFSDLIKLEKI